MRRTPKYDWDNIIATVLMWLALVAVLVLLAWGLVSWPHCSSEDAVRLPPASYELRR